MQGSSDSGALPSSGNVTPPPQPVHPPDTNIVARQTSGPQYRGSHLESSRTAVTQDLGPVSIFPISHFQKLLPPIITEKEQNDAKAANVGRNGRWKQWKTDPSKKKLHEDKVFTALVTLFDSILGFCNTPTAKLVNNPSRAPSSRRSNGAKPDGYLLRQPAEFSEEKGDSTNDYWEDIAVPLEYKKSDREDDRNDNARKIMWSMHHILRNDPSRRFTFGITIEDTKMRVWQCHRAATVVSERFNFIRDHDDFLNVLMSLAFAKTEGLGWDPTLRRRQDVYDIDIQDGKEGVQTFTADKIISDFGAEAMQGRGTRVFRATHKDGKGSTVVVKDVWQDQDRPREGDLLKEIMERIWEQKETDVKVKETNKRLFLSVIFHGDVTPIPPNTQPLHGPLPGLVPQRRQRSHEDGSVGNIPHIGFRAHKFMGTTRADASHIHHRVHYRIAFAEEGQPLYAVHNLRDIFQALVDATHALKFMFEQNLLHRDVSAGNILLICGRGRITDLEYAKKVSDYSQHDVKTGTAHFMAVEVACGRYIFGGGKGPAFKQNPLHDLESLWWVAVWALFTHIPKDQIGAHDLETQRERCFDLFPSSTDTSTRTLVVSQIEPFFFQEYIEDLPIPFRNAADALIKALGELSNHYRMAEAWSKPDGKPTIDEKGFSGIHDVFIKHLTEAYDSSPKSDVIVLPKKETADEPEGKRARIK